MLVMDASKDGVVYFKLAKNMFRVRLVLFFTMKENKDKCKFLPELVRLNCVFL